MAHLLGSFAGMTDFSYFKPPGWVDLTKPPGTTPQIPPSWAAWAWRQITTQAFFFGPTFLWFSVAVFVYVAFPYDLEAAKAFKSTWILSRVFVNFAIVYLYYGFWFCSLYQWGWGQRKFKPQNLPSWVTMFHNIWYTSLGALQGTAWEVVFMHLYASGKLP